MLNLCQFMLIFPRFYLTYLAQAPQIYMATPVIDPKTMI